MRERAIDLVQAETIIIAVNDGVLADSLRFSLELEGFDTRFCDEQSLLPAANALKARGCLVLDQDVFTRMVVGEGACVFSGLAMPVVLIVSRMTRRVLDRARLAGVTEVVEEPLLGDALSEAIRHALDKVRHSGPSLRSP